MADPNDSPEANDPRPDEPPAPRPGGSRPSVVIADVDSALFEDGDTEPEPPPPPASEDAPPAQPPDAAPPPRPSWARRLALGVALVFGGLFGALPAIYFAWFGSLMMVTAATAEILDDTRGLDPGTFESAYWFTLVLNAVTLAWCGVRRIRGTPRPMRPLVSLIVVYAVGLALIVGPALHESIKSVDFPSGPSTLVLLGAESLWRWVAPFAVLVLLGWGLWRAYRAGWADLTAARRFTSLGLVSGLAGLSLLFGGASLTAPDLQLLAAPAAIAAPGDVNRELDGMTRVASIDGLNDRRPTEGLGRFEVCSTELATAMENGRRFLDAQIVWLASPPSALRVTDAEDLVMDTLLKVCRRYMRSAVQELKAYFIAALKNAKRTFCARSRREVPTDPARVAELCPIGFRPAADGLALRQALGQLSVNEQQILFATIVEGRGYDEVGAELGVPDFVARKRKERALRHLRDCYTGEL